MKAAESHCQEKMLMSILIYHKTSLDNLNIDIHSQTYTRPNWLVYIHPSDCVEPRGRKLKTTMKEKRNIAESLPPVIMPTAVIWKSNESVQFIESMHLTAIFIFKDRQWAQRDLHYWTYFRNYRGYDNTSYIK